MNGATTDAMKITQLAPWFAADVGLARTCEALPNSWDKNDPKDAQVILHMLEIGAVQFFHDPFVVGNADIQELSNTHDIVSRSKTELWHPVA